MTKNTEQEEAKERASTMEYSSLYELFWLKYGIQLGEKIAYGGSGDIYAIHGEKQEVLKVIDVNKKARELAAGDLQLEANLREGLLSIYQDELTRNEKLAKTRNDYLLYISQPYTIVSDDRSICLFAMKMPYYDTLSSLREAGKFTESLTIRLGIHMCEALKVLHHDAKDVFYRRKKDRMGIILHMDLKPSNIFYIEKNGQKIFKLGDFGATVDKSEGIYYSLTEGYNAPETDDENVIPTEQADIFSLGMVLYYCASGDEHVEYFREQRCKGNKGEKPSGCSPQLWSVIQKATESDMGKRFQNADEMLDALQTIGEEKTESAQGLATVFAIASLVEGAFLLKNKIKEKNTAKLEDNITGDYYEGRVKKGYPDGKGVYVYSNQEGRKSVSGKWEWVKQEKVTSQSGDAIYSGMKCNGKFTGWGQVQVPEYGTFQGTFLDGNTWNGVFYHKEGEQERVQYGIPDLNI